jgi:copper chaperone NosL
MKSRAMLVMAGLVFAACSGPQPVQVVAGDVCFQCRKMIVEPRYAAEVIDSEGRAFKFRTAGCMARFFKANPGEQFAGVFATDFATGRMVKVSAVQFVPTMMGEGRDRTMDYVAYYAKETADDAARRANTAPVDWQKVLADATLN